jgi:transcriptional regulator with XRE-family HTH domain
MARARPESEQRNQRWTESQVVAHNLTKARELRGMTQAEAAARLSRFTGSSWSATTVAQAEGSVGGQRVRQFTANELVALARTFDLPVLFFFLPPDDGEGRLVTDDADRGLPWEYLVLLLLGSRENFPVLAERAANWESVINCGVDIPRVDVLADPGTIARDIAGALQHRTPLSPDDVLAAAFHGLAARRMRGAKRPGEELATFIDNLRGLADALAAFNNYRPGAFVADEVVEEVADQRQRREQRRRAANEAATEEDDDA